MSISSWFRSNLIVPMPVGPERMLGRFSPDLDVPIASRPDVPVSTSGISEFDGGWRFATNTPRVFTLFKFDASELSRGMLIYRAETRSRDAGTSAYLELWCRIPNRGEYFAKGTHDVIEGYRRWRKTEVPFFLPNDRYADAITMNLTFEEPGVVEMRHVELGWRSVPGLFEPRYVPHRMLTLSSRLLRFTGLTAVNAVLLAGQVVLAAVLGVGDKPVIWWPKKKAPEVGRLSG